MAKLIHIVGPSGAGKSTLHVSMHKRLINEGYNVEALAEPSGEMRDFILNYRKRKDKNALVETSLFSAARLRLYEEQILPRMDQQNLIFLSDRGLPETYVYQGFLGGIDFNTIKEMNTHIPNSDLYIACISNGEKAYSRLKSRAERTKEELSPNETPERINLLSQYFSRLGEILPNVRILDMSDLSEEKAIESCYQMIKPILPSHG
ncbi:AAA family ATPase [Candidatus Pacearchaeota archaeon]|nr:AAA family ATPase [Candidatus Pacearchaeota archaeon]